MSFINLSQTKNSDYAELRYHEMRKRFIQMVDGKLIANHAIQDAGTSARILKNGYWGFASSATKGQLSADKLSNKAFKNAKAMSQFGEKKQIILPTNFYQGEHTHQGNTLLTRQECIEWLNEINAVAQKKYKGLTSISFVMLEEQHRKYVQNTLGARALNSIDRSFCYCTLSVDDKQGRPVQLSDDIDGKGSFSDIDLSIDHVTDKLDRLYQQLMDKREGVQVKGGKHTVVIAPELSGLLAHEAMGHPCEADLVLGGAVTENLIEQYVASDLVNMTDFAHSYLGKELSMPVYADDEGTPAQDVVLIKDGILKGFMHSRESADTMNSNATGNARVYAPNDEPLIRMRNTAILPGKDKLADMIADVEDGYLLSKSSNGQADSTTEFMFGINLGYEIKNGQIGRAIKDTTLSGKAIDMLKTVDAVSTDMHWEIGNCGKKQTMPVSMGGPALRAIAHLGGE